MTIDSIRDNWEDFDSAWKSSLSSQRQNAPLLPENFSVYTRGHTVINHPAKGFTAKAFPTFNHYTGADGGYVALYTHNPKEGVYPVAGDIFVAGQVRLQGHYEGRIFIPKGFKGGDDISQDSTLLSVCEKYFPHLKGNFWLGGDTRGFLARPSLN